MIALNAGAALWISGQAKNLADGYAAARAALDTGAATKILQDMQKGFRA